MTHSRMIPLLLASVLTALVVLGGCAAPQHNGQVTRLSPEDLARLVPPPNPKVPLSDVIVWSEEKATPDAIIKRLRDTGTFYNLNAQQIVDLAKQGVDQRVIDHLVDAQEKARQTTLLTQLADRDAQAAQDLEREQNRRRALQNQYNFWNFGYGAYGAPWGPRYGLGWSYGSYYDPFFRTWRPRR